MNCPKCNSFRCEAEPNHLLTHPPQQPYRCQSCSYAWSWPLSFELPSAPVSRQRKYVTQWFARGGGVAKMGPYKSHSDASSALRMGGSTSDRPVFPADAFIWSEETEVSP